MSAGDAGPDGAAKPGPAARLLLVLIEGYRVVLAPLLGGHCRFYPSCSVYASEAVRRYGAGAGLKLSLKRLGRCHPFSRGGLDPVP